MADPNNIPQEAEQLVEALNSEDKETQEAAKSDVANTNFEKEYRIAQENSNGSGTQSSDPIAVTRQADRPDAGDSLTSSSGQTVKSPGDSDPSDYLEMARDITKTVEAAAE